MEATPNSIPRIRAIANVVSVGSAGYRKLVTTGGVASGWAAEDGARAETATPTFAEIAPPMGDLFANPAARQALLDDAGFRSEERRVGKECVRTCRSRLLPVHSQKKLIDHVIMLRIIT